MKFRAVTYSNVMVTLLAFVVLGGGTAWAAAQLAPNSVGTKQLKDAAVTSSKLADASVRKSALSDQLAKAVGQTTPARIHFDADATADTAPVTIGKIGSLKLQAACSSSQDGTAIAFAAKTEDGGRVQENFQNDSGSDPGQPGPIQSGNLQFDLPQGKTVIGGPPPVDSNTYFRTIATLIFTSGDETSTLQIAAVADGSSGHCSVDGTGTTTSG